MSVNWYACLVEPGRERRVEWAIEHHLDLERYLPVVEGMVTLALDRCKGLGVIGEAQSQQLRGTLIPGYAFLRCEMTDVLAHRIGEMPYVIRLYPSNRAPSQIADTAIETMRRECEKLVRQTNDVPDLDWMLGKVFRIIDGTFQGFQGPCMSFDSDGRPELWLEMFKQLTPVPIEPNHLDLVPIADVSPQDAVDISAKFKDKRLTKRRKSPMHSETAVSRSAAALAAKT